MKWRIIAALAFCLFLAFFITDCSSGSAGMEQAMVNERQHVPAYVWFTSTVDCDGHTYIQQHHEPEQWILEFSNGMELNVDRRTYHAVEIGQKYFIAYRVGRWTGIQYLKNVRVDLDTKQRMEQ